MRQFLFSLFITLIPCHCIIDTLCHTLSASLLLHETLIHSLGFCSGFDLDFRSSSRIGKDTKQSQQQREKEEEEEVKVPSFDECWQAIVAGVRDRDSQDEAVRLLTLGLPYWRNDEFDFYDVLDRITDENMPEALVILDRAVAALGWEVSLFTYKDNSSHERAAALGRIEIIDEMIRLWPEAFRKLSCSRQTMLRWAAKFGAGKDVVNHLMNVSFVNVGWRHSDFDDGDQPLPVLRGNVSTEYPKITEPEVYLAIAEVPWSMVMKICSKFSSSYSTTKLVRIQYMMQ